MTLGEAAQRALCPGDCSGRHCGAWVHCREAAEQGRAVLSAVGLAETMPAGTVEWLVEHANRAERYGIALRKIAEAPAWLGDLPEFGAGHDAAREAAAEIAARALLGCGASCG